MRNSRGDKFDVGDKVKFQYANKNNNKFDDGINAVVNKVDTGIVKVIDGAYIYIEFEIDGGKHICERYPEEILKVLS